jgi:hypothetical protein
MKKLDLTDKERLERKREQERSGYRRRLKENPEKVRAQRNKAQTKYRRNNPEDPIKAKKRQLKWRKENPEKAKLSDKKTKLKRKYGLTPDEVQHMAKLQKYKCAICKNKVKLVIDHCHTKNKVRKLLCGKCNVAIGLFEENIEIMNNAILYIKEHK